MSPPAGVHIAWRAVPPGADRRHVSRAALADLVPGASFVSRCPSCGGDHGRIRVEGVDAAVSVSYVPGWAVVAVTREPARIGIDAVPADAGGLQRVLAGEAYSGVQGGTAGAAKNAAGARGWARVEAVLKADGRGLRVDPGRVRVLAGGEGWTARIAGPRNGSRRLALPDGGVESGRAAVRSAPLHGGAEVDRAEPREWRGWDLGGPAGIVAALAIG